jgi:hypothetical protein
MDADLDTLATALNVRIDDTLPNRPEPCPWRPKVGISPELSDAELFTLAVLQVLLGFAHETPGLAGYVTPERTCGTCSPTCHARPATTNGSAAQLPSSPP